MTSVTIKEPMPRHSYPFTYIRKSSFTRDNYGVTIMWMDSYSSEYGSDGSCREWGRSAVLGRLWHNM